MDPTTAALEKEHEAVGSDFIQMTNMGFHRQMVVPAF